MAYRFSSSGETQRQRDSKLEAELRLQRASWEPLLRDIGDYIVPKRMRFLTSETNRNDKRNNKIINNAATLAWRTARSGLHAGMSSPARPWFNLSTPDPEMAQYGPVKQWLYTVTERMRSVMLRSNIYKALPMLYGDEIGFGFGACGIFKGEKDKLFHAYNYDIGSYFLGVNAEGHANTFVRDMPMTVRQIITQFGEESASGAPKWDNFSQTIKNQWDAGNFETRVDCIQVIQPNERWDTDMFDPKFKRFRSCYYERGNDQGIYLKESGNDYFPILAPRWDVTGNDVYGSGCGEAALGDTKALQTYERRSAQAVDKMINPAMVGPASLRNQKASILPGDVTYLDVREGQQGFKPAFEVRFAVDQVMAKIERHEQRISRTFYEDLFLMLAQSDRRQITAREIDERHEEKLLALGPTLELQNQEVFDPLTDIIFDMMKDPFDVGHYDPNMSLIPPPPPELHNMVLKTEYVSILAQAQKLVGSIGIERVSGYVGNLAGVFPQVVDKFNVDEAIEVYAEMHGTPPKILFTADQVKATREARAKMQQQQAAVAAAPDMANSAKVLSETDVGGSNALEQILGGVQGR